jgi:hypothetical protein
MDLVKTISHPEFSLSESDHQFTYQTELTLKLDHTADQPVSQALINEIVLWKVNRYAAVTDQTLELISRIDPKSKALDVGLTQTVLKALLSTKGVKLPMASAILRFRNPAVYQIIDQRVYRIIYEGKTYQSFTQACKGKDWIEKQTAAYMDYLTDLRMVCDRLGIAFDLADRVLYMADKRVNGDVKLDNY